LINLISVFCVYTKLETVSNFTEMEKKDAKTTMASFFT